MSTTQVSVETLVMENVTSLKRANPRNPSKEVSKKKRTEAAEATKERKSNWELDDTLAFLLLLKRFNMNFGLVKVSLQNDQHRRTDDTEYTLGKYWKNLKAKGKFTNPFVYPAFKVPPQKRGETRLKGEELKARNQKLEIDHAIKRVEAETLFNNCVELIDQMREKEILLKSGEPVEEKAIFEAKTARENIRANRLQRYSEMAKKDEQFQETSIATMQDLKGSLLTNQEATEKLLALLDRLVTLEESKKLVQ